MDVDMHTAFVDEHAAEFVPATDPPPEALAAAAARPPSRSLAAEPVAADGADPWLSLQNWGR